MVGQAHPSDPGQLVDIPARLGGQAQAPAPPKGRGLFAVFDIWVMWNKADRQATVHAEITENTLRAVPFRGRASGAGRAGRGGVSCS